MGSKLAYTRNWGMGAVLLATLCATLGLMAQDTPPKKETKVTHRLPPYFGEVISEEQRTSIYAIQDEFAPKIEELRNQLKQVVGERDKKVNAVLTADQQTQVANLRKEAKAKKKAEAAAKAATATATPTDGAAAKETAKPATPAASGTPKTAPKPTTTTPAKPTGN